MIARGMSPTEARDAARRTMGNETYMREESRGVWVWPALRFNDLLLATAGPTSRGELLRRSRAAPARLRSLLPLLRRELAPVAETEAPLTDDHAPVEWLTDRMLATQIARGRALDDRALPTAPR